MSEKEKKKSTGLGWGRRGKQPFGVTLVPFLPLFFPPSLYALKCGILHEFACHPCTGAMLTLLCIVPILAYTLLK